MNIREEKQRARNLIRTLRNLALEFRTKAEESEAMAQELQEDLRRLEGKED